MAQNQNDIIIGNDFNSGEFIRNLQTNTTLQNQIVTGSLSTANGAAAVAAAYTASPKGIADLLEKCMGLAKNNNPLDLGVDEEPPAVSWTASAPTGATEYNMQTLLANGQVRVGGAPVYNGDYTYGGFIVNESASTPVGVYFKQGASDSGGVRLNCTGGAHMTFRVPSEKVWIRLDPGFYVEGVRVLVDGKYTSLDGTTVTAANQYLFIDSSALATPRKEREITLEIGAQGSGNAAPAVISIFCVTGDRISPPAPYALSFGVLSDSYDSGVHSGNAGGADATNISATANNKHHYEGVLGAMRNISGCNIIANAAAGTGILSTFSSVNAYGAPERIANIAAARTAFTMIPLSINDYNNNLTRYDTSTYAYRDAIQALCASMRAVTSEPLVLYAPNNANKNDTAFGASQTKLQYMQDDMLDAISRLGDSRIVGVPWTMGGTLGGMKVPRLIDGANRQNNGGAGTAGNAYYAIGIDGLHPTPRYGAELIARARLKYAIAALRTMS